MKDVNIILAGLQQFYKIKNTDILSKLINISMRKK